MRVTGYIVINLSEALKLTEKVVSVSTIEITIPLS